MKSPRPSVFSLDTMLVKPATQETAPAPAAPDPKPSGSPELSSKFRTSVYFSRAVHDKLRLIAFEERKSITDLINEGLDHVLTSRNYPTVNELRDRDKA